MLEPRSNVQRDIDILFVGNLHPAVQRERFPWLARLAALADHRRVAIHSGIFGKAYRELLGRARIVFNRSIRGECNCRALEAAAAGAVLFQEAGNLEVPTYFRDRQECVFYHGEDLETLLEYYLDHEDERQAIAAAAHAKVLNYSYEELWSEQVRLIERDWTAIVERARRRQSTPDANVQLDLVARTWQMMNKGGADPGVVADLAAALVRAPRSATLHNALGLAMALAGTSAPETADYFARAVACDPSHIMAQLNCAEALAACGKEQQAAEAARRALAQLDQRQRIEPEVLDAGHFPPDFGFFRVEWERAAWQNAGNPDEERRAKRDLMRWRLHLLLADLSSDIGQYYEAALARPDLPPTQAALGCALARSGQVMEALPHLRQAVERNPFDLQAARALFQTYGAAGEGMGQRRLADARRLLTKAAPQIVPKELWMERVPPPGDELASIIILCCNELECTRLCLESVLRKTRPLYELILVDNGSTDGTPTYLQDLPTRSEPTRVVVIRNDANRGFAAGCNQALGQARGRYLVFLNNDTVVTENWLSGLIAWATHDWPHIGLVGPTSNYAPPPQYVPGDYRDLAGLDAFAARWHHEHVGKALSVERLTGFCLLGRREVLDQVGGFDEGFGLGFFEDDDLCVRAREAGFGLLVARDIFIHHFGSRTFAGLGIDSRHELRSNFERFRAKWGEERAAGYRMPQDRSEEPATNTGSMLTQSSPEGAPLPLMDSMTAVSGALQAELSSDITSGSSTPAKASTKRSRVSLCMIVKNEEANLPGCLLSVADLVDEVIIVDTGSTDETKAVAVQFGAKVHDFIWIDDFAAARNESLRHATGDWIFWMDGDDRLDEDSRRKLRALFDTLTNENAAYAMKCRCLPDPQTGTATVVDHVRLFRNDPRIRWRYRVHEQILPAVRERGGQIRAAEVVIEHAGYVDAALRARKQQRDLRLLELDLAEQPDDPFILFNLGWSYEELRRPADALPLLQRSLELSHPSDSIVRKLYTLIMECHRQVGRPAEALATCRRGRGYYPDDAQLLFQEALLRRELGDRPGAEACLLRMLSTNEGPHFASVAEGLRGHKARHNLAIVYQEQGRFAEAEAQWKAALQEHPRFTPAWLGLGELYLAERRIEDLDRVVACLEQETSTNGNGTTAIAVLRARCHMAHGDFADARWLLEETVDHTPQDPWPWVILSHALLQEGKDWGRAEEALRTVLKLDPGNVEAKNNLTILLHQQKQRPAPPA
jgi:GT2 family glycosyltransferase/Tfp pilus assembly protein PilF